MRAVVTVVGKDKTGIIAKISNILNDANVNIEDISQTILQDYFCMIMIVDIENSKFNLLQLFEKLQEEGKKIGVDIRMQNEEIFNVMHKL